MIGARYRRADRSTHLREVSNLSLLTRFVVVNLPRGPLSEKVVSNSVRAAGASFLTLGHGVPDCLERDLIRVCSLAGLLKVLLLFLSNLLVLWRHISLPLTVGNANWYVVPL